MKAVVKDFHFESLHEPIKPFVLFPDNDNRELLLKLNGQHLPQTISFLESKWKELVPDRPFEYHFMDDDYNKLYDNELRLGKIMNLVFIHRHHTCVYWFVWFINLFCAAAH